MTQQLADRVLVVEIFGVPKISTLAAWDRSGSTLGGGLIVLLGIGGIGFRVLTSFTVLIMSVGLTISSTAAGTSDSNGGETHTHG